MCAVNIFVISSSSSLLFLFLQLINLRIKNSLSVFYKWVFFINILMNCSFISDYVNTTWPQKQCVITTNIWLITIPFHFFRLFHCFNNRTDIYMQIFSHPIEDWLTFHMPKTMQILYTIEFHNCIECIL